TIIGIMGSITRYLDSKIIRPANPMFTIDQGKRNFQQNCIRRSTLSRGNVQRNHRKRKTMTEVFPRNQTQDGKRPPALYPSPPPKKSAAAMAEERKTYAYSARKKSANFRPENSVWKPATSSDSASGISKGVRLVSATEAIRKIRKAICPTPG